MSNLNFLKFCLDKGVHFIFNYSFYPPSCTKAHILMDNETALNKISNLKNETKIDILLIDAVEYILLTNMDSASNTQRKFRLGYSGAGRLMNIIEFLGVISASHGSKPREILIVEKKNCNDEGFRIYVLIIITNKAAKTTALLG